MNYTKKELIKIKEQFERLPRDKFYLLKIDGVYNEHSDLVIKCEEIPQEFLKKYNYQYDYEDLDKRIMDNVVFMQEETGYHAVVEYMKLLNTVDIQEGKDCQMCKCKMMIDAYYKLEDQIKRYYDVIKNGKVINPD